MIEDKDVMPSDAETSGLKPRRPDDREPSPPSSDDKKTAEDPSEQPS